MRKVLRKGGALRVSSNSEYCNFVIWENHDDIIYHVVVL